MKPALLLLALMIAGCTNGPPAAMTARARALAAEDVPENHPHPPGIMVNAPFDSSFHKLRCWNNGEDTVCNRDPEN